MIKGHRPLLNNKVAEEQQAEKKHSERKMAKKETGGDEIGEPCCAFRSSSSSL